jgi:hypothetical protein
MVKEAYSIENKVLEFVDSHLDIKGIFNNLDFNSIKLKKTLPKNFRKESISIKKEIYIGFRKVFNYIYAEIENRENRDSVWEDIYAFPPEDSSDEIAENFYDTDLLSNIDTISYINVNPNVTTSFVNQLLQKARDNKRTTVNVKASSESSKFFFIGDIGIGKSTFIKYIFSKYQKEIESRGDIFWLHFDLNLQYLRRLSIPEAIKFESAKLFRKNFINGFSDEKLHLFKNFLKGYFNISSDHTGFESKYRDYMSNYEPERTQPYDKDIQQGIIRFIEQNYSVIYIIDGLDQLTSNDELIPKIEDIKDIVSDSRRNGVFIFVMREETHLGFLKSFLGLTDSRDLTRISIDFKRIRIIPAKLYDIIYQRFELLIKLYEDIIKENRSSIFNENPADCDEETYLKAQSLINQLKKEGIESVNILESYFGLFLMFLTQGIRPEWEIDLNDWDHRAAITQLKDLIGTNFRKLMDAINIIHDVFVESLSISNKSISDVCNLYNTIRQDPIAFFKRKNDKLIEDFNTIFKRHYKVIPMLLEGYSHYSHPFYYEREIYSNNIKLIENRTNSKFIYSIFYPINCEDIPDQYSLLVKLRVLQFLLYQQKFEIDENQLINFFIKNFPYKEEKIKQALHELLKSHLVDIEILSKGYKIKISRIGQNHLKNLVSDFGYLRIILDDILIPSGFEKYFIDPDPEEYMKNKNHWIILQIPRVALFLLLIKKIEKWEEENSEIDNFHEWSILENIKGSFVKRIVKICVKPDPELEILKNSFQKVFKQIITLNDKD